MKLQLGSAPEPSWESNTDKPCSNTAANIDDALRLKGFNKLGDNLPGGNERFRPSGLRQMLEYKVGLAWYNNRKALGPQLVIGSFAKVEIPDSYHCEGTSKCASSCWLCE